MGCVYHVSIIGSLYEGQCGKLWLLILEWIKFPEKNYLHKIFVVNWKKLGFVLSNVDKYLWFAQHHSGESERISVTEPILPVYTIIVTTRWCVRTVVIVLSVQESVGAIIIPPTPWKWKGTGLLDRKHCHHQDVKR